MAMSAARYRGPDDARCVEEARVQRHRVGQLIAADHLDRECLPHGGVEHGHRPGDRSDHVDLPHGRVTGEREHREQRRGDHERGLGAEQHPALIEPVRYGAAEEAEQRVRSELADREDADRERRVRLLHHEPGLGDALHPGAADRDHLSEEVQTVVVVAAQAGEGS